MAVGSKICQICPGQLCGVSLPLRYSSSSTYAGPISCPRKREHLFNPRHAQALSLLTTLLINRWLYRRVAVTTAADYIPPTTVLRRPKTPLSTHVAPSRQRSIMIIQSTQPQLPLLLSDFDVAVPIDVRTPSCSIQIAWSRRPACPGQAGQQLIRQFEHGHPVVAADPQGK